MSYYRKYLPGHPKIPQWDAQFYEKEWNLEVMH